MIPLFWATTVGAGASSLGVLLVYLAHPNQRALRVPRGRPTRGFGVGCLALGLGFHLASMGPAAAVATWCLTLMLSAMFFPIAISLSIHRT